MLRKSFKMSRIRRVIQKEQYKKKLEYNKKKKKLSC